MIMRFNSMLISCFLFASAVLANAHRPQQLNLPERSSDSPPVSDFNHYWAGAVWCRDPGTFNHVHAIFTVPNMTSVDGQESVAYVLVTIDGYRSDNINPPPVNCGCPNDAMLALGLMFDVQVNGSLNITAIMATSITDGSYIPETLDIPISVDDTIELEIVTRNATTGYVRINNLTNNGTDVRVVNLSDPLCGKTAGWIVSIVPDGRTNWYTLANFGTITFTGASAGTRGGTYYGPYGATLMRNVGNGASKANMSSTVTFSDGPLWITYLSYE